LDKYIQFGGIYMTLENNFQEITAMIEKLPKFKQKAIKWTLLHWDLVEKICNQENSLSPEQIEKELQKAVDTEDYVYYALLVYLKVILKI